MPPAELYLKRCKQFESKPRKDLLLSRFPKLINEEKQRTGA